jgi:seryl-tRNA synthetase
MIDIRRIRQDPVLARAALARRRDREALAQFDRVLELDGRCRELLNRVEQLRAERNAASREFGNRKQRGEDVTALQAELAGRAGELKDLEEDLREFESLIESHLLAIPNLLRNDVPDGDAADNVELRRWGTARTFDFAPQPHWDIGVHLGLFDLPRGAKLAGTGFPLFTGLGARLVRGLANVLLDLHTREHGYTEVQPPYLVNASTARGTGQLPKFQEDLYRVERDELYLLPTSEVPVTNIYAGEILAGASLPIAMTAYTPCFRREAGAHGRDTRGLIRVHQFDKVELVRICRPEDSDAELERMTQHAETALQRLELPHRVLVLAAGDTGFSSARTHDLEVWAPGVDGWLEVSSASTCTDFQARRADIRFRAEAGAKPAFVHTLNASGVAFPRTIIALLENGQQADGSVVLPEALAPYVGTDRLVPPA